MKKRLARLAAVVMSVMMIGSLAACGSGDGGSGDGGSASKGSSGDTIKVGIVIPETGALAAFGAGTQEMTQYALDQINEAGGIEVDGTAKKLELVVADSESNATKASEAANNLISSKNIDIMITSHTADTTVPVAAACERAGVVYLLIHRMRHGQLLITNIATMQDSIQRMNFPALRMHGMQQASQEEKSV